jgi:hypothetical protein
MGLDPRRLAGAILFIARWQAATAIVSPIILPGPFSRTAAGRGRFLVGAAAFLYGVEDPKSLRPSPLHRRERGDRRFAWFGYRRRACTPSRQTKRGSGEDARL